MNSAFYTGALGASQQMDHINVVANNVANVNTYGYKAEKVSFTSLFYRNMKGIDGAKLPRGVGSCVSQSTTDFSKGAIVQTGKAQDYAIAGEGYFALYDPATQQISYTRDGSFTFSATKEQGARNGLRYYLSDGEGRYVLDANQKKILVEDTQIRYPVGVFAFAIEDGLQHEGGGRFRPIEKNGKAEAVDTEVYQGFLESSNADLGDGMVKLIEAQRAYSYALRMVQTADEVETTINALR